MKTVMSFRNFFLNNTPQKAQLIGDLCMIFAFLAGLPALINEIATSNGIAINLPAFVKTASVYSSVALLLIKAATKFMGQKITLPDATEQPK